MPSYTLNDLAKELGADVHGDGQVRVSSIASLSKAEVGSLSFLHNSKYLEDLKTTQASAVLITEQMLEFCNTNAIVLKNPYLAFAKVCALFDNSPKSTVGIHKSAILHSSVSIGDNTSIGPNVIVGENCIISDNVEIGANSVIQSNCVLFKGVKIKPNVSIYHDVKVGENTTIHSNSVIGSDGFGNAKDPMGNWIKVPQLGGVRIGKNVEIGACTSIDRGTIDNTIIEDGVKIDNQIQIGHNVVIGENTALAAQSGVAGSTEIGANCMFGGQTGISGHIKIADNVMLSSQSGVSNSIFKSGIYSASIPAKPHIKWKRTLARLNNLDKLAERVSCLEKK